MVAQGEPAAMLLAAYRDRLLAANETMNLTAVRDAEGVERRHIEESLAVLRALERAGLLPEAAAVIDVGSGGGLPGVPFAIARPDLRVTLLEATAKKAAFLREVAERLPLANVRVLAARAERAAHEPEERERYDLAVARAVAALPALVELCLPLVRVGQAMAAIKGARLEEEIAVSEGALRRCGAEGVEIIPVPEAGDELRLAIVRKVAATPEDLPRREGMPVKRPLR